MNIENSVIVKLAEADLDGIGNKARHLARLMNQQPYLFSVPAGVVLLPGFSSSEHLTQLIDTLKPIGKGPFAVRS